MLLTEGYHITNNNRKIRGNKIYSIPFVNLKYTIFIFYKLNILSKSVDTFYKLLGNINNINLGLSNIKFYIRVMNLSLFIYQMVVDINFPQNPTEYTIKY